MGRMAAMVISGGGEDVRRGGMSGHSGASAAVATAHRDAVTPRSVSMGPSSEWTE